MARGIIRQAKMVQKTETSKPDEDEENHKVKDQRRQENEKVEKRKLKEEEEKEGRKAKRAKTWKPEAEPHYFSDKRRLEDLWKEVFLVGTEWDQLDSVYQYNWSFRNLEDAFEEGGELHGKRVYLFGCTEGQVLQLKDVQKFILVPVMVAIVSPFPPSDKIGITSVQRENEEIVPMKRMKMAWVPYVPLNNRESQVERLKTEIFIMGCTQRRTALKHLKEDQLKKYDYCLPYFYNPLMEEKEEEQNTIVHILYPNDPKPPVSCAFDWKDDKLEAFTDELFKEEEMDADKKEDFKEFLKKEVRDQMSANREASEAREKAREEMSDAQKFAFENMRVYKFYPVASPDSPESLYVNRYYGKAHKLL